MAVDVELPGLPAILHGAGVLPALDRRAACDVRAAAERPRMVGLLTQPTASRRDRLLIVTRRLRVIGALTSQNALRHAASRRSSDPACHSLRPCFQAMRGKKAKEPVGKPILHGSPESPIPVSMDLEVEEFERKYISASIRQADFDLLDFELAKDDISLKGRSIEAKLVKAKAGRTHLFLFDVTLRRQRSLLPAEIILSEEMKAKLKGRVALLPESGCFLCKWILELGPDNRLKSRGEFDVLGQVRHLQVEGIAEFMVPCSQCEIPLPAHRAFSTGDLTACRPCDDTMWVTGEVRKAKNPRSGIIEPLSLLLAVHSPRKRRL